MSECLQEGTTVVVVGAGAHGQVIAEALIESKTRVVVFADDDPELRGKSVLNLPIVGSVLEAAEAAGTESAFIVAVGSNALRQSLQTRLDDLGVAIASAIHPFSYVAPSARIGPGTMVCPGAVVNTGTVIGRGVVLNSGSSIDHHSIVGDWSTIAPGARTAGQVNVGRRSYVCTGAVIGPRVTIGSDSVIAAGSVVLDDVPSNVMVAGTPSRITREIDANYDWNRLISGQR